MGLEERDGAPPRPRDKRVWASVEREMSQVIEEQFREALMRDPNNKRPWAVLLDGNETQLGLVEAGAKRHGVAVTITVDFIHVLEYVWKAAYCFHGSGTQEAEQWVGERALRILHGAEAILKLRSLRSSGDLDEYWKFHRARALERNHASRYANRELPKAA